MYKRRKIDNIKTIAIKSSEINKLVLKSLGSSFNYSFSDRLFFSLLFQKYSRYTSISLFRRFCNINGYAKSVFRLFKMSRHNCKRYSSLGLLSGMRKSSF